MTDLFFIKLETRYFLYNSCLLYYFQLHLANLSVFTLDYLEFIYCFLKGLKLYDLLLNATLDFD